MMFCRDQPVVQDAIPDPAAVLCRCSSVTKLVIGGREGDCPYCIVGGATSGSSGGKSSGSSSNCGGVGGGKDSDGSNGGGSTAGCGDGCRGQSGDGDSGLQLTALLGRGGIDGGHSSLQELQLIRVHVTDAGLAAALPLLPALRALQVRV